MNNEPFRPSFLKDRKMAKPMDAFMFQATAAAAATTEEANANAAAAKKLKTIDEESDSESDNDSISDAPPIDLADQPPKRTATTKPFRVALIDDSKTAVLDRRLILERIHPGFFVKTNIESISPQPILPDMKFAEPQTRNLVPEQTVKSVEEVVLSNRKLLEDLEKPEADQEPATEPKQPKKVRKRGKVVLSEIEPELEENKPVGPPPPPPTDLSTIRIGTKTLLDRLPKTPKLKVRISPYYMNNRRMFVKQIAHVFKPYSEQILAKANEITCANRDQNINFDLLTHQLVVRDYLNLYTPYRGLLLYHGLGSGKTCTSIAIAEGMKTEKRVYIMTPASLKMNFFSELKKCADHLYRKNQFWEFVTTEGQPDMAAALAKALQLPRTYIDRHRGAWFVDVKKPPNFGELSETDQKNIDTQLNEMIRVKYVDINYNGLNISKMNELTKNNTINPFDHSVIIVDEAHNFVSRIVNKINRPKSISSVLYHHLMNAVDAKVVFLTGTPIINYPNEIGVLFNMLRGYIKTWTIPVRITTKERVNRDTILDILKKEGIHMYDYVEYSGNNVTITRNPYGFVNAYKGEGEDKAATRPKSDKAGAKKGGSRGSKKSKSKISDKSRKSSSRTRKIQIKTDTNNDLYDTKDGLVIRNPTGDIEMTYDDDETVEYFNKHNDLYDGGGLGDTDDTFRSYRGIQFDEDNRIDDVQFIELVKRALTKYGIVPQGSLAEPELYKALPDVKDRFIETFIDGDEGNVKEMDLFKRRVLGLTSYFRSAQEQLLPAFVKTEGGDTYHVVMCEMSDFQFGVYDKIRKQERDQEKQMKKNAKKAKGVDDLYEISSTYRIFSRACCNFAFPDEQPRPLPDRVMHPKIDENDFNGLTHDERKNTDEYIDDAEIANDPANEISLAVTKNMVKVPGAKAVKKREADEAKAAAKAAAEKAKAEKVREKERKKAEAEEAKLAKEREKAEKKKAAEEAKEAKRLEKEAKKKKGGEGGEGDEEDKDDKYDDDSLDGGSDAGSNSDIDRDDDDDDDDDDSSETPMDGGAKTKKESLFDLAQDANNDEDADDSETGESEGSDLSNEEILDYQKRIKTALDFLKYDPLKPRPTEYLTSDGLETYSPKFKKVLENLTDMSNSGIHLVYSNFRTIEGVGLLKLILEAAGFEEFKLVRTDENTWDIPPAIVASEKPKFVLYTGTETAEEKEIIRNIYNSTWHLLSPTMATKLRAISENNFMGAVIKIMMITSSGAEGINLRNTRFVHIIEPYWNMVRLEQVIGRARRICSHEDLPPDMRNVKVFCYISTLTEEQRTNEKNIELRVNDVSRVSGRPITTDEYLFEIAKIKDNINQQILKAVKETAIDCSLYNSKSDEKLACYFGNVEIKTNMFLSYPTLDMDKTEKIEDNANTQKLRVTRVTMGKTDYAWNKATNEVYLYDNYMSAKDGKTALQVYGHLDLKQKRIIPV